MANFGINLLGLDFNCTVGVSKLICSKLRTNVLDIDGFILAILPILCEMLTSDYCSIKQKLKFEKEITKNKLLKYVIMNCSCEFLATQ